MARHVALAVLLAGCFAAAEPTPPQPSRLASARERPLASQTARRGSATSFTAAVAQLVPYSARTLRGIQALYGLGRTDPSADGPRYLAAAASLDMAAYATFQQDGETLAALAQIRNLPDSRNTAALYTSIASELRAVRSSVYSRAAQGLIEGVELLQFGPGTERGRAKMLDMIRRRAPAAHVASLFYVDAVTRAVGDLARRGRGTEALAALGALGADPCASGCEGSPLAALPEPTRRVAAAIQVAYRRTAEALAAGEEDPFAALAHDAYTGARRALSRVVLPEAGGVRGGPPSRVLVDVGLNRVEMTLLPQVALVEGRVDRESAAPGAESTQTVRYAPRWGAKVVPYDPFTQAAERIRRQAAGAASAAEAEAPPAPPVALLVNNELEAHILARVILSLMTAGFDDVRLRRTEGEGFSEVRLRPIPGSRVDEEQTRGRAKVEVFGPFDYNGAERTFTRAASAGRPPSAQLVLFALIASRALYRALDAVRVAWPDSEADILLVLPQQVP